MTYVKRILCNHCGKLLDEYVNQLSKDFCNEDCEEEEKKDKV